MRYRKKLKKRYNVCKNQNYCYINNKEDNEDNKVLKYNHGEKSMKYPFIIHADFLL